MPLYFVVQDLAKIEHMYQFSLSWFLLLFTQTLQGNLYSIFFLIFILEAKAASDANARVSMIIAHFTSSIYNNVCASIFEQHKLLFCFLLCMKLSKPPDPGTLKQGFISHSSRGMEIPYSRI